MTGPRNTASASPRSRRACRFVESLETRVLLSETVSLVKDINDASVGPYPAGSHDTATISFGSNPAPWWFENLTAAGGKAFFTAVRSPVGTELWVTDGTQDGTRVVKDIDPVGSSVPTGLTDVNGTLFFIANDGVHG